MNNRVIGIDLGGTKALFVFDNISKKIPTGSDFSPNNLIYQINLFIRENNLEVSSFGIAVPGMIESSKKVKVSDVLPKFDGWIPENDLDKPSFLINDGDAALVDEFDIELNNSQTGGVIMAGTAIGAGFIVDGKILTGKNGWAGELGYFPVSYNGEIRSLDEISGGSYILKDLNITGDMIPDLKDDKEFQERVKIGGETLGRVTAGLINFLNPSKITFGGGTINLPGYWEALNIAITRYSIPTMLGRCEISKVKNGPKVVAMGAIKNAINQLMTRSK